MSLIPLLPENSADNNNKIEKVNKVDAIAVLNKSLRPYRVTSLYPKGKMLEFWRIDSKNGKKINFEGRQDISKELAIICIGEEKDQFSLNYYSINDGTQIIKSLGIKDLHQTIEELKLAGF